jgi:hypothetical protein
MPMPAQAATVRYPVGSLCSRHIPFPEAEPRCGSFAVVQPLRFEKGAQGPTLRGGKEFAAFHGKEDQA